MQPRIAVIGYFRFPPDRIQDVLPHVKAMVEATRRDDGCIAYDIAHDVFEPGVIRVSELWPDEASLQRHTQAPHIPAWHAACRDCGMIERRFTIAEVARARTV